MTPSNDDRKHRTVPVRIGPWHADIDEAIAPLIREMWIAGIETEMSCQQDGFGKVWISFTELADLVRFLNIVAEYEVGATTLYNRMNPRLRLDDMNLAWEYEMFVDDSALILVESHAEMPDEYDYDEPPHFYFTFSVRFPPSDLSRVLARMKWHNQESVGRE